MCNQLEKQSVTYRLAKNMSPEDGTLMASSMYFEPSDSSFYAVSMNKGGILWKISMKDSVYTEVSKPIHNELNYQDCDFSLYTSPSHGKLFLVLDKIQMTIHIM